MIPIFKNKYLFWMLMAGSMSLAAQDFHITRLKYPGGGDWYANPSSLPNFITFIAENTNIPIDPNEYRTELTDGDLYNHPFLYMNGHGNVRFTDEEVRLLRDYLISGGFLHADDNYGMDESFRRQMKRVFPKKELVELPWDHPIFHCYFDFPKGCPKIHEHDGKPAQLLGLFDKGRLIVVYSYQSDLGDGWEDLEVHNDGPAKHEAALKMGTNIVVYAMTH
ncbi:MAG: hypothetical protein AUJ47_01755 [Candidatus Marinimicrobia bacterium CG1_02_48_14]|nr:MAG: hypothetical protein AUJ47_01755 [Candidatus Marinimicrobia bacterium CG1_02_48_14]